MMPSYDHTHKYYKSYIGWGKNRKIVYRCALPKCPHYVHEVGAILKASICWRCNKEFVLPKAISLLTSKPWCPDCAKLRKKTKDEAPVYEERVSPDLDSFIKDLIGGKK
jgi:hypothetical protein